MKKLWKKWVQRMLTLYQKLIIIRYSEQCVLRRTRMIFSVYVLQRGGGETDSPLPTEKKKKAPD